MVTPPRFVALTTRSSATPVDRAFQRAMASYAAGDYVAAASALGPLTARDPTRVEAQFFLGVCDLMTDRPGEATTALNLAARSGVQPYADEAHFYLAKAALASHRLNDAERELAVAVARGAGPDGDAASLLAAVRALKR
jgi:thioredoxin-like negative regulator of GroEL